MYFRQNWGNDVTSLLLDSFLTNLAVSSAFPSHSEHALAPYLQPIFQMSHLTFLSVCSEVWRPSAVMHFSEGPWPGARGRRQICTSAKTHRRPFLCLGLVSLQCFCCGWGCGSLSCTVCPSTREEMNLKSQVSKIQLIEKLQRFNFTSLVPVLQSAENQLRDFFVPIIFLMSLCLFFPSTIIPDDDYLTVNMNTWYLTCSAVLHTRFVFISISAIWGLIITSFTFSYSVLTTSSTSSVP